MTWTTLPLDVCRCLGRVDWSPMSVTCPVRNTCKRYLVAVEGQFGHADHPAPFDMHLCTTDEYERRIAVDGGAK